MADLIIQLGPWSWILAGAAFLIFEILLPGVFLFWIGIAAALTGLVSLQLQDTAIWSWQAQTLFFLVTAIASVVIGRRIIDRRERKHSDEPLLNMRTAQLVGRTATLAEPVIDGLGRIRLDDTIWRISGPDLPAGTQVRVISASSSTLTIEPVRP